MNLKERRKLNLLKIKSQQNIKEIVNDEITGDILINLTAVKPAVETDEITPLTAPLTAPVTSPVTAPVTTSQQSQQNQNQILLLQQKDLKNTGKLKILTKRIIQRNVKFIKITSYKNNRKNT